MPQNLIGAIVDANRTRKDFVADEVIQMVMDLVYAGVRRPLVGVYRLTMKSGSDCSRWTWPLRWCATATWARPCRTTWTRT